MTTTGRQRRAIGWALGALAVALLFIWRAPGVCSLLLGSFILAYVFAPVVLRLARRMPRAVAAGIVLGGVGVVLVTFVLLLVPVLAREWSQLAEKLPTALAYIQNTAIPWIETRLGVDVPQTGSDLAQKLQENLSTIGARVGAPLLQLAGKTFGGVIGLAGAIANLLLIPVLAFYLLTQWGALWPAAERLIPVADVAYARRLKEEIDTMLGSFVRGQLVVSSIIGVLQATGLAIVGIDGGIVIGLLGGLLNMIPYLGVAIGLTLALLMAVLEFSGWGPIIGVLIVFAIVQTLEGMVITPRILGNRVGLSPVLVIVALLAGSEVFGFVGLLLAIPAAAVLRVVLREIVNAYRTSDAYRSRVSPAPAATSASTSALAPAPPPPSANPESKAEGGPPR